MMETKWINKAQIVEDKQTAPLTLSKTQFNSETERNNLNPSSVYLLAYFYI